MIRTNLRKIQQNKAKHHTTSDTLDLEDFSLIGLIKQGNSMSLLGVMEMLEL